MRISLSFNCNLFWFILQAKLKNHIHDPNAPELVHFLFTPMSLIVEASKDPYSGTPDLATKVITPLLTADAKDLLRNCLTSNETDLWISLGEAWTVSKEDWSRGTVPTYYPSFYSGAHFPKYVFEEKAAAVQSDYRQNEYRPSQENDYRPSVHTDYRPPQHNENMSSMHTNYRHQQHNENMSSMHTIYRHPQQNENMSSMHTIYRPPQHNENMSSMHTIYRHPQQNENMSSMHTDYRHQPQNDYRPPQQNNFGQEQVGWLKYVSGVVWCWVGW